MTTPSPGLEPDDPAPAPLAETGSCMIVVATDAPLDARQLTRVARRAAFTLAHTGAAYGHGSCDYAVAFGTRPNAVACAADAEPGPLFEAVFDGVEEAVLDSLLAATTTTGFHDRTVPAPRRARVRGPRPIKSVVPTPSPCPARVRRAAASPGMREPPR
ncbi:P1 family peptidase [Streptomyces hirsutus]|uniref:P1 family peptidase n=1 Tax=Streptomyces hirsutus TaxID=35620 RepID=UPI003899B118